MLFKKALLVFATASTMLLTSCKEDVPAVPAVDYEKVGAEEIRLIVTLPASVAATKATDKFYVAGSFKAPNEWKEKGAYVLTEVTGGTHKGKMEIKIPVSAFENDLEFKIQRNGEWNQVEKDAKCDELTANNKLSRASVGKAVELTVANFRNTGTCPL